MLSWQLLGLDDRGEGEVQQREDEDDKDDDGDDENVENFEEICVSFFTRSVLHLSGKGLVQFLVSVASSKVEVEAKWW